MCTLINGLACMFLTFWRSVWSEKRTTPSSARNHTVDVCGRPSRPDRRQRGDRRLEQVGMRLGNCCVGHLRSPLFFAVLLLDRGESCGGSLPGRRLFERLLAEVTGQDQLVVGTQHLGRLMDDRARRGTSTYPRSATASAMWMCCSTSSTAQPRLLGEGRDDGE